MSSENCTALGGEPKPVRCDARGVLIPDDIYSNWKCVPPESFWDSGQYYVKGFQAGDMYETLHRIPDRCFRKIQCLCLDFGWHCSRGFVKNSPEYSFKHYSPRDPDFSNTCAMYEKHLIDTVLQRGNNRLVVKILWSSTLYSLLEGLSYEEYKVFHGFGYLAADFRNFRNNFAVWGFDEDRVRLISRIHWFDELPNEVWPEGVECGKYEDSEDKIWEIDPVSGEFLWKECWESVRLSYGIVWDPNDR